MKTIIILIMTITATSFALVAQEEKKYVEQTIVQFVQGTGTQDVYNMNYLLHEGFQALISSEEETIVSKSEYMKMLGWKKIGGEELDVEILHLDLTSNIASAKVRLIGKSQTNDAYFQLLMEPNGSWQILHVVSRQSIKIWV